LAGWLLIDCLLEAGFSLLVKLGAVRVQHFYKVLQHADMLQFFVPDGIQYLLGPRVIGGRGVHLVPYNGFQFTGQVDPERLEVGAELCRRTARAFGAWACTRTG